MARFIIRGRRPLDGVFEPAGNKNAALPMLAACLLTEDPVVLDEVPAIADVAVMLELLAALGVEVSRRGRRVSLCARGLRRTRLDDGLCRQIRASILLAGPLAARMGRATLGPPGGDIIGRRRLDTHFQGLAALGIRAKTGETFIFRRERLRGADLLLDEASVTATEHLLMTACLAEGETVLFHAACEPHVTDLARLLVAMGASIEGLGTNRLTVRGGQPLHGATHRIAPDHVEIGSYLAAAAVTGGSLRVPVAPETRADLRVVEQAFRRLGMAWQALPDAVAVVPRTSAPRIRKDLGGMVPKVEDGVWPAFPSDLMSVAIVLATQAAGTVLFFEKMFESRMVFVDRLIGMGANVVICDPHRVVVSGPTRLHGGPLYSPDIRAGMAMLLAALAARGESVIHQAEMIDRGYEAVDARLRALGADIERVP